MHCGSSRDGLGLLCRRALSFLKKMNSHVKRYTRVRRAGALVLGFEKRCFLLGFLSPSRIWRKMKGLGPSRDGFGGV